MRPSPKNVDTEYDWSRIMETHEIMYLVKRSSYEFCFAVPRRQAAHLSEGEPLLQVRFKEQYQLSSLVLEVDEMEDLFEGLSRLMEYVRAEEARRQGELCGTPEIYGRSSERLPLY
jgi:hypothetical protein